MKLTGQYDPSNQGPDSTSLAFDLYTEDGEDVGSVVIETNRLEASDAVRFGRPQEIELEITPVE